jgi:hypothetical protein
MLFVALGNARAGTSRERIARRLQWSYPEGMRVIGEYWLQTPTPTIIAIAEADSIGPIMAATSAWDDVVGWTVVPAVSAEEGMELAKKMA